MIISVAFLVGWAAHDQTMIEALLRLSSSFGS
jgi:hypothetical protein